MIDWIYKWLPRIFGCHCRPDRSFYYKGRQFPLCARCTGELVGIFAGILGGALLGFNLWVSLALMLPLVVDGFVQLLTAYESTNFRRAVTGFLFGYGLYSLFGLFTVKSFWYGVSLTAGR